MIRKHYIFGYDPGGVGEHGVAVMEVTRNDQSHWRAESLTLKPCRTVTEVIAKVEAIIGPRGRLVATGIDTLTAWSTGNAGWRPADVRLRADYPVVAQSVVSANSINGSMSLNGALIMRWLSQREDKGGVVTEAHPKVCYFALQERQERHPWARKVDKKGKLIQPPPGDMEAAKSWLLAQLGISSRVEFGEKDHLFDAALGCLAAFKGLNLEWTTDLHEEQDVIHPFLHTYYWWPDPLEPKESKT